MMLNGTKVSAYTQVWEKLFSAPESVDFSRAEVQTFHCSFLSERAWPFP